MNEADRQRFAGHVVDASERMQRSVDRLLELTRCSHAPMRLAFVSRSSRVRLAFSTDADASVSPVLDRELMKLALAIVVENSIAISPSAATVTIGMRADAAHIKISIADYGHGVAASVLPRIGETFYIDAATQRRAEK